MTTRPQRPALTSPRNIAPRSLQPDPARLAALLARTWLEVRSGRRPFAQLSPYLAPAAARRLQAQLSPRMGGAVGAAARIRRVVTCQPAPRVHEACVLLEQDGRTTALAVRLERHRGVWRAVELTAPEAGLAPLPTASLPDDAPVRDAFDEVADEVDEPGDRSEGR